MEETRLINLHHGRLQGCVYIGRGSFFGNPYVIGKDGDREQVVEKYRKWFGERLKDDNFRKQVLGLRGKVLACYCWPKLCHGNVIIDYLREENSNGEFES